MVGEIYMMITEMVEAMEMVKKAERIEQRRRNEKAEEEHENEVIKWESDIPNIVVRVLLVEADDSTRQIVTALLRKCGYRVLAVSDGLKAWELLKERAQTIDLILTEMDLPLISGFALLSLIMEDNLCKEIPVIMMSSRDPIAMVFKCMLKGAVDYLIKPLRRNELINLWQHVWRRNSLVQRQFPQISTVQEQTLEPAFGNNLQRSCLKGSLGSAPNSKGGDSQSSCTSTSTYLEPKSEKFPNVEDFLQLHCKSASKCTEANVEKMNEDFVLNASDTREKSNLFKPEVVSCNRALKSTMLRLEEDNICTKRAKKLNESVCVNVVYDIPSCDDPADRSGEAVDLIGVIGEHPRCNKDSSVIDDVTNNSSEYPLHLELSLIRSLLRGCNSQVIDDGSKLKHSSASAFSWYNNSSKPDESAKKSEDSSLLNQHSSENSVNGCSQQRIPSTGFGQSEHSHVSSPPPSPQQLGTVQVKAPKFDYPSCEETKSIDQHSQEHNHLELSDGFGSDQSYVVGNACDGSKISVEGHESDTKTVIGNDGQSLHEKFRGMDSEWINQREVALAKFRTKRKDRCFVKKVRYQSRQKLAEQRPRVKGQFVRQNAN